MSISPKFPFLDNLTRQMICFTKPYGEELLWKGQVLQIFFYKSQSGKASRNALSAVPFVFFNEIYSLTLV